jgi:hypothetical protein
LLLSSTTLPCVLIRVSGEPAQSESVYELSDKLKSLAAVN